MRRTSLLLSVGCALVLAGCGQGALGGGGDKRLADIEKQVKASQEQNRDLRTKMAAREALSPEWGWNNFLKQPDFWQCTYDSSWSDCASRCTKQTQEGNKICMEKPEGPERNSCLKENSDRGSACLNACPRPSLNEGVTRCSM